MTQHKWAKEIHAWADGAEIEQYHSIFGWIPFDGHRDHFFESNEFRIKLQPVEVIASGQPFRFKEKKYLYVYNAKNGEIFMSSEKINGYEFIGKIEVQND